MSFSFLLLYFSSVLREKKKKFVFLLFSLLLAPNDMSRGICPRKGYFALIVSSSCSFESSSSLSLSSSSSSKDFAKTENRIFKVLSCCRFKSYQKNKTILQWIQSKSHRNEKKNKESFLLEENGIKIGIVLWKNLVVRVWVLLSSVFWMAKEMEKEPDKGENPINWNAPTDWNPAQADNGEIYRQVKNVGIKSVNGKRQTVQSIGMMFSSVLAINCKWITNNTQKI